MIGRARRIDDARGRYVQFAKDTFPEHLRLDGLKVVIDCANGAAYHVAPDALWELGAEVVPLGVRPTASTSTTVADRPTRSCSRRRWSRAAPTSALRSTATPTG